MNLKTRFHKTILFILLYLLGSSVFSLEFNIKDLPEIQKLDKEDILYVQLQAMVNSFFVAKTSNSPLPTLILFKYKMTDKDSIYSVAAHFKLTWASLSTLNRLPHAYTMKDQYLVIPNIPGVYIPRQPMGNTEKLLSNRLNNAKGIEFKLTDIDDYNNFKCVPGQDLSQKERSTFTDASFVNPIPNARISSGFGMRNNPFTNSLVLHAGLDLVADVGTPIHCISFGKVRDTGFDELYGNYVIIDHTGGYRSLYAHLSTVKVKKNQMVNANQIIGNLGGTGQVTGPHLHIEIYYLGEPKDPYPLLFRKK